MHPIEEYTRKTAFIKGFPPLKYHIEEQDVILVLHSLIGVQDIEDPVKQYMVIINL